MSFIEFGNCSMLVAPANQTKWFSNLYYSQEWQVKMNAYKINETAMLNNGSDAIANYTARAIFSSTIRYILLPSDLFPIVMNYLLYDKLQNTSSVYGRIDKDPVDGQFYYYATCNKSAYQSLWLRLEDTWFEIQPRTYILDKHPTAVNLCRIGI